MPASSVRAATPLSGAPVRHRTAHRFAPGYDSRTLSLSRHLEPAAFSAGLTLFEAVDVRIGAATIVCPDIAVGKLRWEKCVNDAADVILVAEVTSPGNARWDRGQKMDRYAAARIPWHLLVEPEPRELRSVTLRLHRLDGGRYVQHAVAGPGRTLRSDDPFPIAVPTDRLARPLP